jgi:hypothetical protein
MRFAIGRVLLLVLLAGCQYNPLLPDMRTPVDFARDVAPRCQGYTDEAAAPLLAPAAIDSVEGAYSHVQSGPSSREPRLRGARIHVRPLPGFSRESIGRSLRCHQSRVVLGTAAPLNDDPYALAGRWLSIDVDSDGDGFVVQVEPTSRESLDVARDILARATRFASGHDASPIR